MRPEVVFLYELLQELKEGRLRIPRFQRPFVWRRDQMTDLLDSVYNQYPIGSLLVWETDEKIATLDGLGPFSFPHAPEGSVGYLLDGHQRLSTLAGALVSREEQFSAENGPDPLQWELSWDMEQGRFQHGSADQDRSRLFPLTALLDTLKFFEAADATRSALAGRPRLAEEHIAKVSQLARSFQHYRVPVIRIRQTGLTQAVEIFARLNSKGQAMSADQMVSALTYRQSGETKGFDLASKIDEMSAQLGEQDYGDVDRTTILRAILANIGEDIYKTDWTRLASSRRAEILTQLENGVIKTSASLDKAVEFLKALGVKTSRLLPYTMQVTVLSAYFGNFPEPSAGQLEFLKRWFWVSSFSGWFGFANPSRVNSLITEIRRKSADQLSRRLENFDMSAMSLPFPSTFDMRSARTRTLLLVMLSIEPRRPEGDVIVDPWRPIAEKGPDGVGYVFNELPRDLLGNPANRMIRPPGGERGSLRGWIDRELSNVGDDVIASHGLNPSALRAIANNDVRGFISARQDLLIDLEHSFQRVVGVRPSDAAVGGSPVDTD
ncbi:DUF262 domain-containing protein [Lentzea sp. NBC_00516]|uniref:DUF262 domain-containing protein n=1 Tax=Lentzea sp. NBC_00516 TaxID=2903582 RepID=UPI002E81CAA3|nr:DUF262 domain-containing protein [Lentzea sp. NBC_00516]WUD21303.1 DUF262 domain-containing protein [Lentzea sp. NBC_00516]